MAQESILFPNDPPQDGDQFTIGNTTYAWDPTPGIWRAFTTATSSSGGSGGGALLPWLTQDGGLTTRVEVTGITTRTLDGGTGGRFFLLQAFTSNRASAGTTVEITGTGSWAIVTGGTGNRDNETFAGIGDIRQYVDGETFMTTANAAGAGSNLVSSAVGFYGYIPAGGQVRLFNGTTFFLSGHYWEAADAPSLGGGGTTVVNIGGGGGLQLGEFFSQTVTASTTSLTLDHTGPAWVFLTAGSGSGAVRVNTNTDPLDTGRGGNGGSGGFFLQDVSVLEGANVVLGTGGVGRSISRRPNAEQAGASGTGSSITWSGITLTCTAGAGAGIVTNGADGMATITGTDAPTLLTNAEVTTEAEAYWRDFVVTDADDNLQLGSSSVSVPVATGRAGDYTQTNAGETGTATSLAGSAGRLYIVYQNQA